MGNPMRAKFVLFSSVILSVVAMSNGEMFDTNFVELDSSKMITTGDSNYAILNPNFSFNWRSVSVNGDEVVVVTKNGQLQMKKYHSLTAEEKKSIESMKGSLSAVVRLGPFNVKSQTGLSKLTTFDRNGGTSTMGSGGSGSASSSSSSSSSSGGASMSKTGDHSFIVSRQDFPFNWQRVFVNDDLVTIVYRDGRVSMMAESLMRADEKAKIAALRQDIDKSAKAAEKVTKSLASSLKNPMDFVNKALGGMFG